MSNNMNNDKSVYKNLDVLRSQVNRTNIVSSMISSFELYSNLPCCGIYNEAKDIFEYNTYNDMYNDCKNLGSHLYYQCHLNNSGDFVGVLMQNSYEWYVSDFCCTLFGYVLVPLPIALTTDKLINLINLTQLKVLIYDDSVVHMLRDIINQCKSIKYLIYNDKKHNNHNNHKIEIHMFQFSQLCQASSTRQMIPNFTTRHGNDIFTLIFTSGSTGVPKGAIISHNAWNIRLNKRPFKSKRQNIPISWLSFQPSTHMLDRKGVYFCFLNGGRLGFCNGVDALKLMNVFAPTSITATSRFWIQINDIYTDYLYDGLSVQQAKQNIKNLLGHKLQIIVNSGAPISIKLLEFLRQMFECKVVDAYGSTEMDHVTTNGKNHDKNVKWKLIDVNGYYTSDIPYPRGELVISSPSSFSGYYNDPKATSEAFIKINNILYYRTGDICVNENGILKTIDRRKHISKLSQGEFVAPERLESRVYAASIMVKQIYLHVDSLYSFIIAIVYPSAYAFKLVKTKPNITLKQIILNDLIEQAIKHNVKAFEIPRSVIIAREAFTLSNNCLTGPGKIQRHNVKNLYKNEIKNEFDKINNSLINLNSLSRNCTIKDLIIMCIPGCEGILQNNKFTLKHLGGDSLSLTRLSTLIKRYMHVNITINELLQADMTLKRLEQTIKEKKDAQQFRQSMTKEEYWEHLYNEEKDFVANFIENECQLKLQKSIQIADDDQARFKLPTNVLLTGCTGFIGSFLLRNLLLLNDKVIVYCLVRGNDENRIYQALSHTNLLNHATTFQYDHIKRIKMLFKHRIVPIFGDLGRVNLGLNDEMLNVLRQNIDVILHSGAFVNHVESYAAHRINVIGTKTLITLAAYPKRIKKLLFISSVGALTYDMIDKKKNKIMESTKLGTLGLSKLDGYSQSKYASEKLIQTAYDTFNLPILIMRCAFVGAHSISGFCNPKDMISRLILTIIELKQAPMMVSNYMLDITSVDWVSHCIMKLAFDLNLQVNNTCYHVVSSENKIKLQDIVHAIKMVTNYEIKWIQYNDFINNVLNTNPPTPFAPLVHRFRNNNEQRAFKMDLSNTKILSNELQKFNINNEVSLKAMISFLFHHTKKQHAPSKL